MGDEIVTTDNEFGMGLVNMVKMSLSVKMAEWHERLLTLELPNREDYAKEEDFKEAVQLVMVQSINAIQKLKGDTFRELLETYIKFNA